MNAAHTLRTTTGISELRQGDTVEINGHMKTVNKNYIKHNELFGWTYEGAPYPRGIIKITFKVPTSAGFRYQ